MSCQSGAAPRRCHKARISLTVAISGPFMLPTQQKLETVIEGDNRADDGAWLTVQELARGAALIEGRAAIDRQRTLMRNGSGQTPDIGAVHAMRAREAVEGSPGIPGPAQEQQGAVTQRRLHVVAVH